MSASESKEIIINESQASINEEFLNKNLDYNDKAVEDAFKDFTSKITSAVNTTFANFNSNHEEKMDSFDSHYEKTKSKLNEEIQTVKKLAYQKQDELAVEKEKIVKYINKLLSFKLKAKAFSLIKSNVVEEKHLKVVDNIINNTHFRKKKINKIFAAWKLIAFSNIKARVTAKHYSTFTKAYENGREKFNDELKELTDALQKIEVEIAKEIEERKKLASIYDEAMSKAANTFVKENEAFTGFNSSNVQTPKERMSNRELKKGTKVINY